MRHGPKRYRIRSANLCTRPASSATPCASLCMRHGPKRYRIRSANLCTRPASSATPCASLCMRHGPKRYRSIRSANLCTRPASSATPCVSLCMRHARKRYRTRFASQFGKHESVIFAIQSASQCITPRQLRYARVTGKLKNVKFQGQWLRKCVRQPGCWETDCSGKRCYRPGPVKKVQVQCPSRTICKKVWVPEICEKQIDCVRYERETNVKKQCYKVCKMVQEQRIKTCCYKVLQDGARATCTNLQGL